MMTSVNESRKLTNQHLYMWLEQGVYDGCWMMRLQTKGRGGGVCHSGHAVDVLGRARQQGGDLSHLPQED
jgi:hypothetical protein